MSPIIKVCGMREADNIREVEIIGIDMMGFIFWPKSSRYVSERPAYLPTNCQRVGVFVNEVIERVKRIANDYALSLIQLHGNESPEYVGQLREWKIIKAFNVATTDDIEQTNAYEGLADYFLFDTKGKSVGGNGEQFDWDILQHYKGDMPFLLSGGIGPEDAEHLKHWHHPKCIGIDINSRFEIAPAYKDTNKITTFINTIRTK
jgi:phosphoribosylanthranilate isomerase